MRVFIAQTLFHYQTAEKASRRRARLTLFFLNMTQACVEKKQRD